MRKQRVIKSTHRRTEGQKRAPETCCLREEVLRVLVKVGNEVLRNVPPKLGCRKAFLSAIALDEIAEAIKNNQVVIVSGETGSGKTTQLP